MNPYLDPDDSTTSVLANPGHQSGHSPRHCSTLCLTLLAAAPIIVFAGAAITDTLTRVGEISDGALNIYGATPLTYATIVASGVSYLIYNSYWSYDSIKELRNKRREALNPEGLESTEKTKESISFKKAAFAGAVITAAAGYYVISDGSTNFFFLNELRNLYPFIAEKIAQDQWRAITWTATTLNVVNFLLTEGVKGALKFTGMMGLTDYSDHTNTDPQNVSRARKIATNGAVYIIGGTGAAFEAAIAFTGMLTNFKSVPFWIPAPLCTLTAYANYALRGKIIRETIDKVLDRSINHRAMGDGYINLDASIPSTFSASCKTVTSTILATLSGALVAFALQPLTVTIANDNLDDLTQSLSNMTYSDTPYKADINPVVEGISIINALNDFIVFAATYYIVMKGLVNLLDIIIGKTRECLPSLSPYKGSLFGNSAVASRARESIRHSPEVSTNGTVRFYNPV